MHPEIHAHTPGRQRHPGAHIAFAAFGAFAACAAIPASAQEALPPPQAQAAAAEIDIPAQPLDRALTALARQSGARIVFSTALTEGWAAPAVRGRLTVAQALQRLLASSGLVARQTGEGGGYTVVGTAAAATATAGATLAEVKVTAAAENVGRTEGSGSYAAQAVGKGQVALRDVPRSVSVLTRQQLDDQQITTLDAAVEQLPGVTLAPSTTGYMASSYYTRGFKVTSILVDGSPSSVWNDYDTSSNTGMAKYDNVQLLRGPDAVFSGSGQPSGAMNLVRKKPLAEPHLKYRVSAGSWNNYQGEVDVTGKIAETGNLRGRLVAAYNDRQYFFGGADRQLSTLYGTLAADLGERTELTVGMSHDRNEGSGRDGAPHLPRYATGEPLPVPRGLGYTRWSFTDAHSTNAFASLRHDFGASWIGHLNASRTASSLRTNVSSYNGAVNPRTGTGSYLYEGTWAEGEHKVTAIDGYVTGQFDLLGRRHRLIAGADHRDSDNVTDLYYGTAGRVDINDWRTVNPDALLPRNARGAFDGTMASRTREQGAYANARFELGRGWSTTLGGRYSRIRIQRPGGSTWDSDGQPYIATNQSSGNFIPFYALAYELSPHWSAYFTVARSFEDQSNYYTESGRPLSPTTGRSFELGVKGEHWDGLLQTNLTVYRSRRDNFAVRVSDPSGFDVPGRSCCYSGDGRFLAQGIEAEVSGKLAQGWQVNAGYTYDDNETSYGASDGTRYASYTPKHIFKLASRYDLWGSLAGWTVGGGVRAQSSFFKSGTVSTWNPTGGRDGAGAFDGPAVAYRFTEPGRAVWNLFVEHRLSKSLTLALNINNLFDKRYFSAVGNTAGGNIFGEPRSVGLTLRGQL
ncbi:MAG: hypothetical protein ABT02_03955 [Comamonadaceae bacterium SCN 68-20]|nr:TonB-dependent siderophore receptor [Comamonadaceae bacterium]ODU60922.1 MAG: hypothetical protein ABT02_03955 [Comamonadaceae bacterium SCN 68-20]OJX24041.1 MAG: hypothetical protein BGO75_01600 [Burkholderiales bacterium 68-20]